MTKDGMKAVVSRLVDELRELPSHTEITTYELACRSGFGDDEFSDMDLLEIDYQLSKAARKAHIKLDGSKHDGLVEGLSFNLDYIVDNSRAYIRCPRCGSKNTVRIIYGMPAMNESLAKKIDAGKVYLGGCCVTGADVGGKHIYTDPKRRCNDCKRPFASAPVFFVHEEAFDYRNEVRTIHYRDGGFFQGHKDLTIKRGPDGIVAILSGLDPHKGELDGQYSVSKKGWDNLLDTIFTEYYLHEWKKRYQTDVLDGEQWEITITLSNGKKKQYSGSNAFPVYWKDFQKSMERIIKKCKPQQAFKE